MSISKFELFKSQKDNQFYWHLRATNHKIILQSEGYKNKQGAENGIESVRENAPIDERYQRLNAKNGEYYFTLTAANSKVIGVSETYTTKHAREIGIAAVKREAPSASVIDLTDPAIAVGIAETAGGLSIFSKANSSGKDGLKVKPKGGVYGQEQYL